MILHTMLYRFLHGTTLTMLKKMHYVKKQQQVYIILQRIIQMATCSHKASFTFTN